MQFLTDLTKRIPSHMDFDGQRKAERIFQVILLTFGFVGFAWGYVCQQFSQTVYILAAGFLLSALLTLPPWPMYRRGQLKWQAVRPAAAASAGEPAAKGDGSGKAGQSGSGKRLSKKEK